MYLYNYLLIKNIIGCGESPSPHPTLITKQIAANGTYTAAEDNADGYDEVTVNVDLKAFVNSIVNAELNER